jgi:hypothetical protein
MYHKCIGVGRYAVLWWKERRERGARRAADDTVFVLLPYDNLKS